MISTSSIFFASVAISVAVAMPTVADDDKEKELPQALTAEKESPTGKADAPLSQPLPSPKPSPSPVPATPAGSREHPQVVRTPVPRLIFQPDKGNTIERAEQDIASAIVVGFGNDLAFAWDTRECRWLYAWRGGFIERIETESDDATTSGLETSTDIIGELIYLPTGPAPLSVTMGAAGGARYFGHRMVEGVPEFLYTVGMLKVSERIFPSEDGSSIVQKFSVERQPVDLILAAPFSARANSGDDKDEKPDDDNAALKVTNGTLKGDYIYVDSKKAADFALSHRIGSALPRPTSSEPRPVARPVGFPLLTQSDSGKPTAEPMPAPKNLTPDPEPEPQPQPKPKTDAVPETKPAPKPKADTPPKPKKESKPAPAPAPAGKSGPIITKAQRYDRDILLTDPHIETASLKQESTAFSDRDFKFSQLPDEVVGADHVRTFDRDKYIPGNILSYQLELGKDATVWLMFDKRLKPLPKWIGESFTNTGKIAVLDSGETFLVLRADVDAGKLRLGPQDSGAGAHFYLIAASPRSADAPKRTQKGPSEKAKSE